MQKYTKGLLFAFLGVGLMSVEAPLIRLANMPALSVGFYFGLAIFVTTQLILLRRGFKYWKDSHKKEMKGVMLSGFFMGVGNFCFISAVTYTGIANTVLILASAPVVSALIALWLLGTPTPKRIYIAAIVIFVGLYIIFAEQLGAANLKGNFYAMGALFSISGLFITLAKYQKANRIAFVSMGGLAVMITCIPGAFADVSMDGLLWVLIMGVVVTPLSRILIGIGTRFLIPAEMGLILITESILAPIWGWWWLNEVPPISTFIGGGIIVMAIFWNTWMQLKTSPYRHKSL